ncbi:unnamed protein product [Adineta steineri]|uniref:Uncharacterized protein n=2 Tax=Adineta steineri TaxID=433720 RepID=A0A814P2Z8_9BILA|nr:unnamed protein product [Adineta steineri]CAF3611781.1 unnamed protein product [Adineta steineri]
MSQNGTTPTTDENRVPTTIPQSLYVPMMPMFFPYGNGNVPAQQFFAPTIYPNVSAYPSNGNHRHGNFGVGYNAYYTQFYPTQNNILPQATHVTNPSVLISQRPLMPHSLPAIQQQQQQQHSLTTYSTKGNDNERNMNLNIRECQSPVINETKTAQIIDLNDNNNNTSVRVRQNSSSTSSLRSHSELDQNIRPHLPPTSASSSSLAQEIDSDNNSTDDFLTFIEQKTKTTTAAATTKMPELNPFANEFSFASNKTLTNDSSITTNGIDNHTSNENHSSYRLLFDNLIEKSLESIEVFKQSTKKVSVNDISTQCNPTNDCIHRSTQTIEHINNSDLIKDYSLRTIKLMDKLIENFRTIYQNELHNEYKTMAQTCDELRHLILFIHRITLSLSDDDQQQKIASIDLTNPFSNIVQDLANDTTNINKYQISSQITHSAGRGTRRLMSLTSNSPVSSFSCRQIDPIAIVKSNLCLICQKPLDDTDDDVMHSLCRSLSSYPNVSTNT